jgi:hypothetical protein
MRTLRLRNSAVTRSPAARGSSTGGASPGEHQQRAVSALPWLAAHNNVP